MKALVINLPRVNGYPVVREERFEHSDSGSLYPPLNLLYTGTTLLQKKDGEGISVSFFDMSGFDLYTQDLLQTFKEINPDIIITRLGFDTYKQDLKALQQIKEVTKAKTYVTSKIIREYKPLLEKVKQHSAVDIFVEEDLISYFMKKYSLEMPEYPDWSLLPDTKWPYHTGVFAENFFTVSTTFGCPFNCTFCSFGRTAYKVRPVDSVIAEVWHLKNLYGINNILFFDDVMGLQPGRLQELCKKLKPLNISWSCCTRANILTEEDVKLMSESGCHEIAIGVESGNEQILKNVKKGVTKQEMLDVSKWCKKYRVLFYALCIIGLPGETKDTVMETVDFLKQLDPFYTQFCFATPFPNTEIFKYYKDNKLLLTEDWSKYCPLNEHPVIKTEEMSAKELIFMRRWAYKKMLFRPLYLLKQLRWDDWRWNIKGLHSFLGKSKELFFGKVIR